MSKKLPDRFMETGDNHVTDQSFTAEELKISDKSEDDETYPDETDDGSQGKNLRARSRRPQSSAK
jgi:hypothetical protein